jgi:hypothetical protein
MADGRSNWKLVAMVRDIDKVASKLPAPAAHVLMALALHGGDRGIFPSESRLSRETGMTDRNVRRMLAVLVGRDLISVTHGRQHTPNSYTLRPDVLSALPTTQTGRIVRPDGPQTGQSGSPGRTFESPRVDISVNPDRTYCPPKIQREDLIEDPKEEEGAAEPRAAAAAAPVGEGEFGEGEAFAIADEVATRHGRAKPHRNTKSRKAIAELIAEAMAAAMGTATTLDDLLRLRLDAHYARDQVFLAERGYALAYAKQVPQEIPRRHKPIPFHPRREEQIEAASTPEQSQAMAAALVASLVKAKAPPAYNEDPRTKAKTADDLRRLQAQ